MRSLSLFISLFLVVTQLPAQTTSVAVETKDHQQSANSKAAFDCNITQSGIYFVNALGDVNLKFYTMPNLVTGGPNSYSYYWIFTYADASTSWSYDREPYIPVPCDNPIKHAYVKVSETEICYKEINKTYPGVGICGTDGSFAINRLSSAFISVSSNPATSTLSFSGKGLANYTVSVYDHTGTAVVRDAAITKQLDLSKFGKDVYVYAISDASGFTQRGKIIKLN